MPGAVRTAFPFTIERQTPSQSEAMHLLRLLSGKVFADDQLQKFFDDWEAGREPDYSGLFIQPNQLEEINKLAGCYRLSFRHPEYGWTGVSRDADGLYRVAMNVFAAKDGECPPPPVRAPAESLRTVLSEWAGSSYIKDATKFLLFPDRNPLAGISCSLNSVLNRLNNFIWQQIPLQIRNK